MDQYINANSAYYDVTGKDYPEFTKLKEKYNKV